MAFIYLIINKVNGKPYVGATIANPEIRWKRHVRSAIKEEDGQALHDAIRKYGSENFEILPIMEHQDKNFVFNTLESYFIEFFHAHGSKGGYNMTTGGDGWLGMKHSQETKDKISKANKGKIRTPEMIKQMSESRMGKDTWNKGRECPQISKALKGRIFTEEQKQVYSESHKGFINTQKTKDKIKAKISEESSIRLPNGKEVVIINLRQFCKENGLSQGTFTTYKESKGYKLLYTIKKERTYTILNENTNEIFTTNNLKKFCKEHGAFSDAGLLTKYRNGRSYLNWKILNVDIKEVKKIYN